MLGRGGITTADQGYLSERIRETILSQSDEEVLIALTQPRRYTTYALNLMRKELARRKRMRERQGSGAAGKEKAAQPKVRSRDCWVEVWRESNFKGESVRIHGPSEVPTLRFGAEDWSDRITSLRVGPGAFVLAYRDKEFKAEMVSFGPNQEVPNLRELKFDNEIDSLKLIDSMKIFDRPPFK